MVLVTVDSSCHPVATSDRGACGMSNRPVCLEHARGFVFGLPYKLKPLWDEAPRLAKKKAAKK